MNVKSIAGQMGERRSRFALSSYSDRLLAGHWNVSDLVALTKPRVMMLAVFTALVGLSRAPVRLDPLTTLAAVLAIAAGAGAGGVLNMWYDADIDAIMSRTAMRPIPRGKISRFEALVFGLVLAGCAVVVLALATNLTAAALLACTILFYIVVYTAWLKRATRQNIVIGGAAGALPPVIGWAAATGEVGLEPLVLFLIIFLWTPPHFWALALNRTDDYARAGVPMLPVVAGRAATTRQILIYSGLLAFASELPWLLGFGGALYGAIRRHLRNTFPSARSSAEREHCGRSPGCSRTFSLLHLLLVRTVRGSPDRSWRCVTFIHALAARRPDRRIGAC
jgi:protoheme IX farnesyltransferase